jgi:hypothetical protein
MLESPTSLDKIPPKALVEEMRESASASLVQATTYNAREKHVNKRGHVPFHSEARKEAQNIVESLGNFELLM